MRKDTSGISVINDPFADSKEVLGGYALVKAEPKDEVIALAQRFLNLAGGGTCEIYQLYEMPVVE